MTSHPRLHTLVPGDGHRGIGHSGVGGSALGDRESASGASSQDPIRPQDRRRTDAMSSHPYLETELKGKPDDWLGLYVPS